MKNNTCPVIYNEMKQTQEIILDFKVGITINSTLVAYKIYNWDVTRSINQACM